MRHPRTSAALVATLLGLGLTAATAPAAAAGLGFTAVTVPQGAALQGAPTAAVTGRVAPHAATVTVTGEGSATAAPDLAVAGVGVEVVAPTAQAALAAQNEAAAALLDAVRAQGVAERDVRTESVSLNPVHEYQNGTATLKGYQAAQSFSVRVRDIARTGAVLRAVTDATGSAGRIHSLTFALADPAPLRARARDAAYHDAHTKAEQYARLSGHRLGRLISLTEASTGHTFPTPPVADAPGAVPLAPGEIRATATVTAVYELA